MSFLKKRDVLLILLLAAGSIFAIFLFRQGQSGRNRTAEIYYETTLLKTIPLDLEQETRFSVKQAPHVVFHVDSGGIRFEQSDCPDQICVHTGKIRLPGQTAACLPNKLLVKIVAEKTNGNQADIIIG